MFRDDAHGRLRWLFLLGLSQRGAVPVISVVVSKKLTRVFANTMCTHWFMTVRTYAHRILRHHSDSSVLTLAESKSVLKFPRPPALTEGGGTCGTRLKNEESAGVCSRLERVPVVPAPSAWPLLFTSLGEVQVPWTGMVGCNTVCLGPTPRR